MHATGDAGRILSPLQYLFVHFLPLHLCDCRRYPVLLALRIHLTDGIDDEIWLIERDVL